MTSRFLSHRLLMFYLRLYFMVSHDKFEICLWNLYSNGGSGSLLRCFIEHRILLDEFKALFDGISIDTILQQMREFFQSVFQWPLFRSYLECCYKSSQHPLRQYKSYTLFICRWLRKYRSFGKTIRTCFMRDFNRISRRLLIRCLSLIGPAILGLILGGLVQVYSHNRLLLY